MLQDEIRPDQVRRRSKAQDPVCNPVAILITRQRPGFTLIKESHQLAADEPVFPLNRLYSTSMTTLTATESFDEVVSVTSKQEFTPIGTTNLRTVTWSSGGHVLRCMRGRIAAIDSRFDGLKSITWRREKTPNSHIPLRNLRQQPNPGKSHAEA